MHTPHSLQRSGRDSGKKRRAEVPFLNFLRSLSCRRKRSGGGGLLEDVWSGAPAAQHGLPQPRPSVERSEPPRAPSKRPASGAVRLVHPAGDEGGQPRETRRKGLEGQTLQRQQWKNEAAASEGSPSPGRGGRDGSRLGESRVGPRGVGYRDRGRGEDLRKSPAPSPPSLSTFHHLPSQSGPAGICTSMESGVRARGGGCRRVAWL